MKIDMSKFLDTFFEESAEGLDAMETGLLNLQQDTNDKEIINTIFRAAHSIKGGSATFGLSNVAQFTHHMETLLDEMRSGKRAVTRPAVAVLLDSVDNLRAMFVAEKGGQAADGERSRALSERMEQLLGVSEHVITEPSSTNSSVTVPGGSAKQWRIAFLPHAHLYRTGNDPVRILRELSELGEFQVSCDVSRLPRFASAHPEDCALAWTIELSGDITKTQIASIFEWVAGDCELTIECVDSAIAQDSNQDSIQVVAEASAKPRNSKSNTLDSKAQGETTSIRVAIDKVDALINMVGELVITQSMLGQIGKDFDMSRVENLVNGLAQLERNTRELQESVMRIRMMPISFAFQRFPRMVHDLSQKLNKKIDLRTSGEQTELDKTVMERISDPLVHLVRNAVDHGIESPEVRRTGGKPETGVVHLNAYHQGGNIVIEIKDDGAGLNRDKIIAKARKQELIGPDDTLTDEDVHELLFLAGFSTADHISDVSGRGVGMDVVRKNIKALGGSVEVESEFGKGSTFRIRLPLTLAIMDGQSVLAGQENYIIPLVSIVESIQLKPGMVNFVAGMGEVLRLRDEVLPILRLYKIFNATPKFTDLHRGLLVVVEGDGRRVGLFVDELQGQQQVVIKSLETNFRKVPGVSGATILGDGTVALIVDIPGLIQLAQRPTEPDREKSKDNLDTIAA